MTRVVVLPSDESACGYYRMRLPAGAVGLARPEWTIEVYRPSDVMLGVGADGKLWEIRGIADPTHIDLVVMQRVATPAQVQLLRWFQGNGTAVVVDADDAMWCIDRENSAWKAWNGDRYHWRHLDEAAALADLTTVTTPYLAQRYGKHGRTEVLPNCVPGDLPEHLESVRPSLDQTTTIGWAGFTATHPGDLRVVGNAVRRVQADTGCIVRVIGDAEGASRDWGCTVEKMQPTPIGLPYYMALTALDIGLVPLKDNGFNRGKSYLKALEYAACGVAVVASDTPANRELAKTIPMRLAKPGDWAGHLEEMLRYPHARETDVDVARLRVYRHHTYEANADRWIDSWERALNRRARMSA